VGQTAHYIAIGTFKQSTHPAYTQDITDQVTWGSSAPGIATISNTSPSDGVATAVGPGVTTITATDGGVTAHSDLTVTGTAGSGSGSHTLLSVAVDPGTQTLNVPGQTAQFIAIGTFSSTPTSVNLTNLASTTWTSSDPTVANFVTPASPGLITVTPTGCPTSSCTVTVTATGTDSNNDQVAGQAILTVAPTASTGARSLASIAIVPNTQILNTLGENAQFIAIGTYTSSPTTVDLTQTATWNSSDLSVATVGSKGTSPATTPGQATAIGCAATSCLATITAQVTDPVSGAITGSAALTVSPGAPATQHSLTNITIIPGTGSQTLWAIGQSAQFIAIGTYNSSPVTKFLTDDVIWQSSDVNVASITTSPSVPSGLATAQSCSSPVFPPVCGTVITATCLAANPNCEAVSDVVGTSNLEVEPGGSSSNLPELTVYTAGGGLGTVTSAPAAITCTSGDPFGCTGFYPSASTVTLTATPSAISVFGGFSANCAPVVPATNPASCTVTMNGNQSVGAIFN
jgi:hypothetical protein